MAAFKSFSFNLSTAPQTLYTVPNNIVAVVILCQAANVSDTNQSVTLTRHDAIRNLDADLAPAVVVPSSSAIALLTGKLALMSGDILSSFCATDSAVDLTITVMETPQSA